MSGKLDPVLVEISPRTDVRDSTLVFARSAFPENKDRGKPHTVCYKTHAIFIRSTSEKLHRGVGLAGPFVSSLGEPRMHPYRGNPPHPRTMRRNLRRNWSRHQRSKFSQ
jgi:hypothetical protein